MQKQNNSTKIISFAIILSLIIAPIFYAKKAYANAGSAIGAGSYSNFNSLLPTITRMPQCESAIKKLFSSSSGVSFVEEATPDKKVLAESKISTKIELALNKKQEDKSFFEKLSNFLKPTEALAQEVNLDTSGTSGTYGSWGGSGSPATAPEDLSNPNYTTDPSQQNPSINIPNPQGTENLSDKTDSIMVGSGSVSVHDANSEEKLNAILKSTDVTAKNVKTMNTNDGCLNTIGKLIAKKMLQELTLSTVEWIKTGNGGAPFFVQEPGKFFGDIARKEILSFNDEMNDPVKYPYAKDFMKSIATNINNRFQDNAQYSLDKMVAETTPEYTGENFKSSFSSGGWAAWDAMTQIPANNPMGFQIIASNELSNRLAGTSMSQAEEVRNNLSQSSGFLGDQKCVDPKTGRLNGITVEQDKIARKQIPIDSNNACLEWKYVTPGQTIADITTKTIKYPDQGLIDASTLNDAIAAILDATIARFSNELTQKGLANMSTDPENYAYTGSSYYNNSTAVNDFPEYQISASTWLQQNPNFNIRTDIDQALIDTQRTYSEKLALQSKELQDLILVTYQLDYCIPGPHPGWENDSRNALDAVMGKIAPQTQESLKDVSNEAIKGIASTVVNMGAVAAGAAIGASLGSAVPILGTAIGAGIGLLAGGIISLFSGGGDGSGDNGQVALYYASIINGLTGLHVDSGDDDNRLFTNLLSIDGAYLIMNGIFDGYVKVVKDFYYPEDVSKSFMPTVTNEAAEKFNKLPAYKQMIEENTKKIESLKGIISRLGGIKENVDSLREQLSAGSIDQDTYENDLSPIISEFGRISSELVSGDDIASADTLKKQATDEKKYIYNQLLKGPYGCENQMSKFDWRVLSEKRIPYPVKLPYDYNNLGSGQLIPDLPGYPAYKNKMPAVSYLNTAVPGILGYFQGLAWDDDLNTLCNAFNRNDGKIACDIWVDAPLHQWGPNLTTFESTIKIY